MRILFTSTPNYGHLYPLVPFARALADAGHEVAFAMRAAFAPALADLGFRHFPAGLDRDINDVYPELRTWRGPDRVAFVQREVSAGLRPRHMIPAILALAATWPPDSDRTGNVGVRRVPRRRGAGAAARDGDRPRRAGRRPLPDQSRSPGRARGAAYGARRHLHDVPGLAYQHRRAGGRGRCRRLPAHHHGHAPGHPGRAI